MNKQNLSGFTLTELMITVAILGIVTSTAVPSFSAMLERNRLKEAVESLKSDLMFARTEAIKQSTDLNISIDIDDGSWCYGINNDSTACDCTTAGDCAVKTVDGNQFQGTTLTAGTDVNMIFRSRRGTTTANGITLNTTAFSARVVSSLTGRIRICSPDSSKSVGSYDAC